MQSNVGGRHTLTILKQSLNLSICKLTSFCERSNCGDAQTARRLAERAMRTVPSTLILLLPLACGGCLTNSWHLESYFDEHSFPAADAAAAVRDERRIIGFLPSLGVKPVDHPPAGSLETEAVFIRSDNDHFHITITVRCLARLDQPGFVTTVRVDSYNVGEEGAIEAGKSMLNEIDQLYRKGG